MDEAAASVKVPLFSAGRERQGDFELSGAIFRSDADASLLHEAVRMQLAKRRAGTALTKTKGFISGGGRKPWRQKGTGRARAGSTRSPLWRHGGKIFGPQPRDYSYKMPKKAWRRALALAIADRAANGHMIVVERLELMEPKTKVASAALATLGLTHALIVVGAEDASFARAARNLAAHKILSLAGLNVFDVLNYDQLLMTAATARAIEARLGGWKVSLDGMILAPLVTEKGTIIGEKANQVVFRVRPEASKDQLRLAVEEMFKVTVVKIRTANFIGKERRKGRIVGHKSDWKKAYVTLKAGDKIEFFEGL